MNRANMFWQTYLNLENEVLELSKYIYFTDTTTKIDSRTKVVKSIDCKYQLDTYSSYIADLLVRCCVEIEAISKELYFDDGGTKIRGSNDIYFDTDCLSLLNDKWKIADKVVMVVASNFNLQKDENRILTPLKRADERSKTVWSKAYQAVKHDRYNSLYQGNIKALLHAMAALYLLNIYYRDIKLSAKYLDINKLDMSFGSRIFSLKTPNQNAIVDVINGIKSEEVLKSGDSPYIAKYTDSFCKQVLEAKHKYLEDLHNYLVNQPEMNEQDFIQQIMKAKEIEAKDPAQKVILLWELCKYRINKKIPANLSFEQRKTAFVQSAEWNGQIRKQNKHLSESELTPENIQREIDQAGILFAMGMENSFSSQFMYKAFTEGYCEIVLDKGNVKYL